MKKEDAVKPNGVALIPFLVFVVVYLGAGILLEIQGVEMAFYQFPAPIAVVIGIISAFILIKGDFDDKFNTFIKGCGDSNIITMCIIYLLAGAFATVCQATGGIDSIVNLGMTFIPSEYLAAGIFVISAFIATATGSSVGSAAAVGPIAVEIANKSGLSLPLIMGCLISGIMLGDNLSIISDTTIAATRTQGVEMKDKFRMNFWIAIIPGVITFILLILFARPENPVAMEGYSYSLLHIMPYIIVLTTAILGMDVFTVLILGTVLAGGIGIFDGNLTFMNFVQECYSGFLGMIDILLLSLLTGGLAEMVNDSGGVSYLLHKVSKFIKGNKSAQLGIGLLVSITDIAVANNTVAIIINGDIARNISEEYQIDPRRTASLLDIFACIFQGIIPYGAQMLIVSSFTNGQVSPIEILPYAWFLYLLAISAITSIFIPFADGISRRDPWNYEKWLPASKVTFDTSEELDLA